MKIYQVSFSPTGGTKKAAESLCRGLGDSAEVLDLTVPEKAFAGGVMDREAVCVVAMPVYGGRVPALALKNLKKLQGNGAAAVLLAVYGNRAYEDALLELRNAVTEAGFVCAAAVTAVAEHSIVRHIASGRPDEADEQELVEFGAKIREKLERAGWTELAEVPGNEEYKEYNGSSAKPITGETCVRCGSCARKCPAEAIPLETPDKTDWETCISCMRCISICPMRARAVSQEVRDQMTARLNKLAADHKNNELYL